MVHLPGMNTPQFDWSRSKMPRRAQPVPPIYQPEVAARAIVWAAHHADRRELLVGWPTWQAIHGERLAPAVADRVLARSGEERQQTPEPEGRRPDNLWHPVPGDFGAHGRFDAVAKGKSPLTWAAMHRGVALLGLAGVAVAARLARRAARP
jgi:hypothetical protein